VRDYIFFFFWGGGDLDDPDMEDQEKSRRTNKINMEPVTPFSPVPNMLEHMNPDGPVSNPSSQIGSTCLTLIRSWQGGLLQ